MPTLAVIVTTQFMVALDTPIVNVALPATTTELHFPQESPARDRIGKLHTHVIGQSS